MRTHSQTFDRDDETDVVVSYTFSAGCAAHYGSLDYPGHPAEPAEVEIVKARGPDGQEVTLTEAEDRRMCDWLVESHGDPRWGPDPDDERDRRIDDELMERGR